MIKKRENNIVPFILFTSFLAVTLSFIMSGCASKQKPLNIIKGKPQFEDEAADEKKDTKRKKGKYVWVQRPLDEESVVKATARKELPYAMNFENITIAEFIEAMMSGVFKQNYLITDAVRAVGKRFTIKMTEDLKPDRAFTLFTRILAMYNVSQQLKQNVYVFDVSEKPAEGTIRGPVLYGRRIPDNFPAEKGDEVTFLVPFYNIEAKALKEILDKQLPPPSVVFPIETLNLLVISGSYDDVKYTLSFIDLLDRAQFKDKSILMITPEYWDIDDFQDKVKELMAAEGAYTDMAEKTKGILFIPIEKLNSLIVISPVKEWMERVLYWLEKLDVPEAAGEAKKVFSYKLKNVEVDSVYEVLQSYKEGTAPNLTATASSRGRLTGSISGKGKGAQTSRNTTTRRTTSARSLTGRTGTGTSITGMEDEDQVAIIPILETNSIILVATPVEYKKYADILKHIDVPRQQVFVEVIIGEVKLDDSTQLGLEFWINRYLYNNQFGTKGGLGVYRGQDGEGNNITPSGSNFFVDGVLEGTQFEVLINALVDNSKINIISTPKITVVENEEAEISVGSDVPVIASESVITSGGTDSSYYPIQSVQYIQTGIILKVKAAILSDNKISLAIEQEISEALENQTSTISSPEILKRNVKTTLIVSEGEIAFIGGLFQKKLTKSSTGIPVLSKIPLLGNLFKNTGKQINKTELVVFINSKTIRKSNDMKEIVEEVKKIFSGSTNFSMEKEDK